MTRCCFFLSLSSLFNFYEGCWGLGREVVVYLSTCLSVSVCLFHSPICRLCSVVYLSICLSPSFIHLSFIPSFIRIFLRSIFSVLFLFLIVCLLNLACVRSHPSSVSVCLLTTPSLIRVSVYASVRSFTHILVRIIFCLFPSAFVRPSVSLSV